MDSQEKENTNNSSTIMDLENLQKEYSNLLKSYQAAVAEYINYLNQPSKKSDLISIKGQAYTGTGSAGTSNASTLQQCIASCSASKTCSGATFVSNKCLIRTGDSTILPSSNDSYAIVPKEKQLLLNMESINEQLLEVNEQLLVKIKSSQPIYYESAKESNIKNKALLKSYNKLLEERKAIEEVLKDYKNLESNETQHNLKLTQNYYYYILMIIFSLLFIVLLYYSGSKNTNYRQNIQYGGDLNSNSYFIVFGLIIFILIIKFFYK